MFLNLLSFTRGNGESISDSQSKGLPLSLARFRIALDGWLFVMALSDFLENIQHVSNARRVSRELDNFLIKSNELGKLFTFLMTLWT